MATKLRVGIIFGGRSTEHEISLRSARSVLAALDTKKYKPVLIGITKSGAWLDPADSELLLAGKKIPKKGSISAFDSRLVDVVFPVLHGSFGEDGTMQGFLKIADVPFVGPGVLASALGMDKDFTKRILRDAGISVADGMVVRKHERDTVRFSAAKKKLGLPVFVKPANAGSSVGVSKVRSEKEFLAALDEAFKFDVKILIEKGIIGREIEVAVMGNEFPEASIPGEVLPAAEFYSYDAKYASSSETVTEIPAKLSKQEVKKIQQEAVKAYSALGLEGMTRVDFFYTPKGELLVNEVNTIPGFTSISMYPKMWEASGVSYPELLDKLIGFALARYDAETALKRSI